MGPEPVMPEGFCLPAGGFPIVLVGKLGGGYLSDCASGMVWMGDSRREIVCEKV